MIDYKTRLWAGFISCGIVWTVGVGAIAYIGLRITGLI